MAIRLSDLTDEQLAREVTGPGQVITRTPSQIAAYRQQLVAQDAADSAIQNITASINQPVPKQNNIFTPYVQNYGVKLKSLMDNPASIQQTAAYKFRVGQGQEALQRALGARGLLNSGNRLSELTKYGQDMASQEYDNQVNRLTNIAGMYGQNYNVRESGNQADARGWADMNSRNQISLASLLNRGGSAGQPISRTTGGMNLSQYNPSTLGGNWNWEADSAFDRMRQARVDAYNY